MLVSMQRAGRVADVHPDELAAWQRAGWRPVFGEKPPAEAPTEVVGKPLAEMTIQELRDAATAAGVQFSPKDSSATLRARLLKVTG